MEYLKDLWEKKPMVFLLFLLIIVLLLWWIKNQQGAKVATGQPYNTQYTPPMTQATHL